MAIIPGQHSSCFPLLLPEPIVLDARPEDWPDPTDAGCGYQSHGVTETDIGSTDQLKVRMAKQSGSVYFFVNVKDDKLTYRHPDYFRPDTGDHFRIELPDPDGISRKYVLVLEDPGAFTTYQVKENWRELLGDGLPVRDIRGFWRESGSGYAAEFRIPEEIMAAGTVSLSFADKDLHPTSPPKLIKAFSSAEAGNDVFVYLGDAEIERIVKSLDLAGARITIIDRLFQVRARVPRGRVGGEGAPQRPFLKRALESSNGVVEIDRGTMRAAYPVKDSGEKLGVVLVQQARDRVLSEKSEALKQTQFLVIGACVLIALAFVTFAFRLVWRIRRVRTGAEAALDSTGRVIRQEPLPEETARDEIGQLSRTLSDFLRRSVKHSTFLESVPRTLRHELDNPLNVLSTSLQSLADSNPQLRGAKYMDSAERGVERISAIVRGFEEAASLEDALRDEELEKVDLAALVGGYTSNMDASRPGRSWRSFGVEQAVWITGSGFRVEQMLDKLVDNALDHSEPGTEILLGLSREKEKVLLVVENDGPMIALEERESVFHSMYSSNARGGPHLGMGLYIVQMIAQHMGGSVRFENRNDESGVQFIVSLPLAEN